MGDDRGGIVDRLRSLLGLRRRVAVPPGRTVFTASDLPSSLVPPAAGPRRDDDLGDAEPEPTDEIPDRGSTDDVAAETPPGEFLDLDVDLDLDALYDDLEPEGPATPEPLFGARTPGRAAPTATEEPEEGEPAELAGTADAEPTATAEAVEPTLEPVPAPARVVLEEDEDHRTLGDLADELARFAERPDDSPSPEEPAPDAGGTPEPEAVPVEEPAATSEPEAVPADEAAATSGGLFAAHPRAGAQRGQARVHDDRLERRSPPIRLTPSEAVRLAEDGPDALRRLRRPSEDR